MSRPRRGCGLLVALTALSACTSQVQDAPATAVVDEDGRAAAVRQAREAMEDPVPALVAAVDGYVGFVEDAVTATGDSRARAAQAAAVDPGPVRAQVAALRAVPLRGETTELATIRGAVDDVAGAAEAVTAAGEAETDELATLVPIGDRLRAVTDGWGAPGSRSRQVEHFEGLVTATDEIAEEVRGRTSVTPCVGAWERRAAAATVVAERTEVLLEHVRQRDGTAFDEDRSTFLADALGTGGTSLGDLDAAAAATCWAGSSPVAEARRGLTGAVDALAAALNPPSVTRPSG